MTCRAWSFRFLIIQFLILALLIGASLTDPSYCKYSVFLKEYRILSGNVDVTAIYDLHGIEKEKGENVRYHGSIILYVSRNDKMFRVFYEPFSRDSPQKSIEIISRGTVWKDGYLFVPSSCGTGNAWKCYVDYVFTIKDGELVKLGTITGYKDGLFYDIYNWIEINPLTCHASAPLLDIVMREEDGVFVTDLDRTWELNIGRQEGGFSNIIEDLQRKKKNFKNILDDVACLLYAATLAKYCGKLHELELVLYEAKRLLPTKEYVLLNNIIQYSVVTGDSPFKRQTVQRVRFYDDHPNRYDRYVEPPKPLELEIEKDLPKIPRIQSDRLN